MEVQADGKKDFILKIVVIVIVIEQFLEEILHRHINLIMDSWLMELK